MGGEHAMQYIGDILQNYAFETHIVLLTDATSINLIKIKIKNACLSEVTGEPQVLANKILTALIKNQLPLGHMDLWDRARNLHL